MLEDDRRTRLSSFVGQFEHLCEDPLETGELRRASWIFDRRRHLPHRVDEVDGARPCDVE